MRLEAQWESTVQLVRQPGPLSLQAYPLGQSAVVPVTHTPAPSQRLAVVSFVPVHDAATHSVVAALLAVRHPSTGSHQYCLHEFAPLQLVWVVDTGQVPLAQTLGDVNVMLLVPPHAPAVHWAVLLP